MIININITTGGTQKIYINIWPIILYKIIEQKIKNTRKINKRIKDILEKFN